MTPRFTSFLLVALCALTTAFGGIENPPILQGGIFTVPNVPVAGTSEVQTLTFGGTPTGGTFRLSFAGKNTAAITWSSTNATLVSNIDTALEALRTVGTGNVTTAVGTMTAGIGTITVTFAGNLARLDVSAISVLENSMTGTAPTLTPTTTTPGVTADGRRAQAGRLCVDSTTGILYSNTSTTALQPTWTKVGAQ